MSRQLTIFLVLLVAGCGGEVKRKRVVVIDTKNQTITESSIATLEDQQKIVGGYIERAMILENGDEVYVNEEGLFDREAKFFEITGGHQPFAGNAYIIGKVTSRGDTTDAVSTTQEIKKITMWRTDLRIAE